MFNRLKYSSRSIVSIVALFLIGCKRQEIVYYEVTKEETPSEQEVGDSFEKTNRPMLDSNLPPETLGHVANPDWTIPESWLPGQASTMRRGSFIVTGPGDQSVDISVTTFSGDVGGELMNINRWRLQVGLDPITVDSLDEHIVTKIISNLTYRIVDFSTEKTMSDHSHPQRTLVAILNHEGNSWFFKMTGDVPLVGLEEKAYMEFLTSISF